MTNSTDNFENAWGNLERAASYAKLEFPNTYYLAYRDLPDIIARHVNGIKAIDFGCGTGRSTRFLKNQGFEAIGIDISEDMLLMARKMDQSGDYRLVENNQYTHLGLGHCDLIQAIFTFDNIPGWELRTDILKNLSYLLNPSGKLITLHSTPEIYTHEWVSFSTKDFPENWKARTGDIVRTVMLDVDDTRPVEDIFWAMEDYYKLFNEAGLTLEATYKPLGKEEEPYPWVTELNTAPWMIFVTSKMSN